MFTSHIGFWNKDAVYKPASVVPRPSDGGPGRGFWRCRCWDMRYVLLCVADYCNKNSVCVC